MTDSARPLLSFLLTIERILMKRFTFSLPVAGLLFSASTFAAETHIELPELIISADFRPATAQETPISLTIIDEETIRARNAQHIEEVLNLAPNVNVSSGASRGQFFQIRGMGERSQFAAPINPSVGLNIDGIDFSRTGGAATLFDIDSVEVLRGPQGTKFGGNALAGSINMRSTEPTKDFKLRFQTGIAEYNTRNVGVAVGGSIIEDKLLGRASIFTNRSDGYMDNVTLGRDNTQNHDELTFRSKFKWLATDDLTVDFTFMHLDIDNGYDAFTFNNSRRSQADNPGEDSQNTDAFAVKTNWQATDGIILQSEMTYLKSDIVYSYDADWGFAGQFDESLFPYIGFEAFKRKRENTSIELRALSDKAGRIFNDSTDWTVGLFYFKQNEGFNQNSDFGVFGATILEGDYKTENTALYGQLDSHLTEKLTLITGARIERFSAKYDDSNALGIDTSEPLYGGKVGLNYQATNNQLLYTTLSRGYKSGGVNNNNNLNPNQRRFNTEYLWNYEAGVKSSWLNGALLTHVAAFYAKREDAQVKSSQAVGVQFIDAIANAAKATHMGIEADVDWFVTDQFRVIGALGLLDATFDLYENAPIDIEGRQVAQAPNYQYTFGAEWMMNSQWTLRANVEGKDDFFFSDSNNAKSNAYALVNASIDYKLKHWKVALWARNLFDKDYGTRGFFFGNNPANGYTEETYIQYGEPRIVGLTATYEY
jgi:iron complex outermembrane recepter protein